MDPKWPTINEKTRRKPKNGPKKLKTEKCQKWAENVQNRRISENACSRPTVNILAKISYLCPSPQILKTLILPRGFSGTGRRKVS